ncbi:MAG: hypothetical protein WB646_14960 [Steroidobacteraceae bacterium]
MRTRQAGQSALLLLDVIEILRSQNLDYAVIGAFALSVHGVIRATTDVDALLFTTTARLARLRTLFEDAGFAAQLRRGDASDPIPGMLTLSDTHDNHVELLGSLRGMDPELFSRALVVKFLDQDLRIVGREDFIAMKCFAGGPQDLLDASSAYRAASAPIDLDLLRRLSRRFGRDAADHLEQILAD